MNVLGSTSPVTLNEELDPTDPAGARFVLTPGQSLPDGRYRLLLAADNLLTTDDGHPVSTGGADLEISTFTVGHRWGGVSEAVDAMTGMVMALTPVPQADPAQ